MIQGKINKALSKVIILITTLHVITLAAYIFDYIPDSIQQHLFYNIDRLYCVFLMSSLFYITRDKNIKIVLGTCLLIYVHYFLIANWRYLIDLTDSQDEINWKIYFGLSTVLIILNSIYHAIRCK